MKRFRPSLPDSLPAIGAARDDARVFYAFGHGHLGLTQSAATAQIVAGGGGNIVAGGGGNIFSGVTNIVAAGGGNIADTLIDWIERKPHGWVRARDARPESTPYRVWEKKCVVLMNEHSYSNGEIFPSAMRTRGLATIVGDGTQTDYLLAESALYRARSSLVQARHAVIAARVELARVLGELNRSWIATSLESQP